MKSKACWIQSGYFYGAKKVIITTGTFLNGLVHIGTSQTPSGRAGELASVGLANQSQSNSALKSAG
ncbi:MAG: FAD-dependent oxidoreductase [Desulfosudis oleivorans]|nr:FAD-dependent oxidoreductase [Desulfosudis oleivorans]